MKLGFSLQFFQKYSHIKLHESPFRGSRVVPLVQTDGQFTNAPKNVKNKELSTS